MATTAPALTGTWTADPVHSSAEFSARHMLVSTFRGRLPRFAATFRADGDGLHLTGEADATAVVTEDAGLTAHLQSPEFLDTQRHPVVRFASRRVRVEGGDVEVEGDLTMKGITRPVVFRGTLHGPVEDPWGNTKLGLEIAASVERSDFDMHWNAPLPGGGLVLGGTVALSVHLELARTADAA